MEKNTVVGNIVDTTLDLFKIADLSQLAVYARRTKRISRLDALTPEQASGRSTSRQFPTTRAFRGGST